MQRGNQPDDDPLWYKDGIIYQVHIKAFNDSNNDGIGDIIGLTQKLDYIRSLGISLIWLLPFYPSPLRDDGYDIADYLDINPDYGTLEDFRKLLKEAHKRGLKVITELVLNHTSERHELFQRARKSPAGSSHRNFYVWSDTPEKYKDTRIIFQDFESSNWSWDPVAKAYYWHRFYWHQPDLNFDNPEVHRYFKKVVDFWFEMGVDGMRLDAVPYLYEREGTNCENLPETHAYLKQLSAYIKKKYGNRMLLAEANQWPEDAVAYFGKGDECQMAFHFPLMPRIFMAVQMENRFPIIEILEQTPPIPENCQWAMFLRNHDELTLEMVTDEERDYMYRFFAKDNKARINLGIRRRLAPLVENNRRKIELLNILLFSFPGTPVIYYGDEIGMGDNYYLGDRNGVRTPMQWSPDRNSGFSDVNPQRLFLPVIIDPEYHYETINVAVQQRNASSLLWWIRRAISIRNNYKAFGRGTIEFLSPENPKVLAFYRKYNNEVMLIVVNLSRFPQVAELDLKEFEGYSPIELFSRNSFPPIKGNYMLTLNAYDHYWFSIEHKKNDVPEIQSELPIVDMQIIGTKTPVIKSGIENILLDYLIKNRLIDSPSKIQKVFITDEFRLDEDEDKFFAVTGIEFIDRNPEYFLLPLSVIRGEAARVLLAEYPKEIVAKISTGEEETLLVNGLYDESFRHILFRQLNRKTIRGEKGRIIIHTEKRVKNILSGELKSSALKITDDNSTEITFNDAFMIKFYKRIDEGINPGEEIQKYLTSKGKFYNIRPYAGSISCSVDSESYSLGLIKESVHYEQSAWNYFLDCALDYLEQMRSNDTQPESKDFVASLFKDEQKQEEKEPCIKVPGICLEMIRRVGALTGELHLKISAGQENPAFVPEPFSTLYQRSLFQSMRSSAREVFRIINQNQQYYDADLKANLQLIWENENKIYDYLKQIINRRLILTKIRIHGNLHLANILFTGKDFLLINFEGAYTVPPSERRLKRSALRDAASVILSLYFTAFTALEKFPGDVGEKQKYESYAEQWWYCMSSNFLASYLEVTKDASFVPRDKKDIDYLLRLYTLEKLILELKYFLRYDASAAAIPARALKRICETLG